MPQPASRIDRAALHAIRFYQRRISPHKGFCCAHAALHDGESCSVAVSRIIREDGLLRGRTRIAAQFAGCREAHTALRSGSPLALGANVEARGVCCLGPIPIPFRCG